MSKGAEAGCSWVSVEQSTEEGAGPRSWAEGPWRV